MRSEQEGNICFNERGSSQETQKGGSSLFNKNGINELHVSDQYVNEIEQSLLVCINDEMEGDQSIWVKSCVICLWDIHLIHTAKRNT